MNRLLNWQSASKKKRKRNRKGSAAALPSSRASFVLSESQSRVIAAARRNLIRRRAAHVQAGEESGRVVVYKIHVSEVPAVFASARREIVFLLEENAAHSSMRH